MAQNAGAVALLVVNNKQGSLLGPFLCVKFFAFVLSHDVMDTVDPVNEGYTTRFLVEIYPLRPRTLKRNVL